MHIYSASSCITITVQMGNNHFQLGNQSIISHLCFVQTSDRIDHHTHDQRSTEVVGIYRQANMCM